jgi:hypothetical protein
MRVCLSRQGIAVAGSDPKPSSLDDLAQDKSRKDAVSVGDRSRFLVKAAAEIAETKNPPPFPEEGFFFVDVSAGGAYIIGVRLPAFCWTSFSISAGKGIMPLSAR